MLSLENQAMGREIKANRLFRAKFTERSARIDKKCIGNWVRSDSTTDPQPENMIFAWKSFHMPNLCYSSPDVRIRARRPSLYEGLAKGMESAMEVWIGDSDFLQEFQGVIWDMLSGWGVMKVGLEGVAQSYGQVLRPFACRVPRDQFVIDRRCERWTDARMIGHEYFRDKEDLAQEVERFDPALAGKLAESDDDDSSERYDSRPDAPDRHLVKLVDLWVPEHGIICTMVDETWEFIRPPTKYWGPSTGPYQLFQFFDLPGNPFGMSPLQASMEQIEELNQHVTAAANEAATAKSFWLVEAARTEIKDAMLNARTGDVVPVTALANNVVKVETGTMSNRRMEYLETVRDRTERILGFSAAQQGAQSDGRKSATEISTVQQNSDQRIEWMRTRVSAGANKVLGKVLWYLFYDPSVVMPVKVADGIGGYDEGLYLGGQQPGQEDLHVTDFVLEVDSESMRHSDDEAIQQRWLQLIQVFPSLAQIQQMGGNVRYIADQLGSAMNVPNMSEVIFTPEFGAMLTPPAGGERVPPGVAQLGQPQPQQPAGLPDAGVPPINQDMQPVPQPM